MPKKGETNNPNGRPKKQVDEKYITPKRQLGRVDDETWDELKSAAERSGKSFTQWAMEILLRAARRK